MLKHEYHTGNNGGSHPQRRCGGTIGQVEGNGGLQSLHIPRTNDMHRRRHELDDDEQRNNHVRHKKWVIEQGMEKFIREEVDYQEQLEAAGYRSPTLKVLRALQSLLAAEQLQGESAVTTPPFPPSAGRGTVQF
jgi:hypothetical protein